MEIAGTVHKSRKAAEAGRTLRVWRLAVIAMAVALLFSAGAWAQFDIGNITGAVMDSSGAAVPNSTVTVTNTSTGVEKTFQHRRQRKLCGFGASLRPLCGVGHGGRIQQRVHAADATHRGSHGGSEADTHGGSREPER